MQLALIPRSVSPLNKIQFCPLGIKAKVEKILYHSPNVPHKTSLFIHNERGGGNWNGSSRVTNSIA